MKTEHNFNSVNDCHNDTTLDETPENSKRWIALDSATTTGVTCDKECVKNIQHAVDGKGKFAMVAQWMECEMSCDERALTNLFCLFSSMKLGFRMNMDSDIENAFFVEKIHKVQIFQTK